MDEQEAKEFLASLNVEEEETSQDLVPQNQNLAPDSLHIDDDVRMLVKNQEIIDSANELLLERLQYKDKSLRVSDINAMKADAFKQNQQIQGNEDEIDASKLIPTNIYIQVNNK